MWIYIPVNPDPWAIGPLNVGRKNGRYYPYVGQNSQLAAFKEAVKEELLAQGVDKIDILEYRITMYFWRQLDAHEAGRKHGADATNLQKATEDALQGILFENDRDVLDVRSVIVEQSGEASRGIAIHLERHTFQNDEIPEEIWDKVNNTEAPGLFDNSWGGV